MRKMKMYSKKYFSMEPNFSIENMLISNIFVIKLTLHT
ncbi:hypothetical protein Mgra_00006120 [Meloidogyne graminicola]|uniref:Uncharacterized protein n=1 Tax=Meloidogyne graminicola TaxID=189291 RepID=A0A8S9ZMA3_9BILA|nr:hypothetical protein Mgra_00006120 [Meloidogyne graminicola]